MGGGGEAGRDGEMETRNGGGMGVRGGKGENGRIEGRVAVEMQRGRVGKVWKEEERKREREGEV